MPDTRWDRIKVIFAGASARSGLDRDMFLDRECGDDPGLRSLIESLLGAQSHDSPVNPEINESHAPPNSTATAIAPISERPGTRIGPYKLLQQIGEGGFGVVFMAEQLEPVRRRVALKIIKLGMDTRRIVARFEAERQALAMMDHPNIAKVLDAGATESGRPYFVMELVKGDPVTEYADREHLSIPERMELFTQICNAVQHAHTKGIIHRDIKPSNVLCSTQDGRPHAKIIDFGIAKATDHHLTEKTLFTEHKALIGTPAYMSPEQAEGSLDIDMRTDVYSLGVLMYELLTGTTPFDNTRLREAAYAEMQRIIREVEPQKPSTRISNLGSIGVPPVGSAGVSPAIESVSSLKSQSSSLDRLAALRRTEPKKLGLLVRGELDWIVMKSLDKDRARRYETANAFAADVQRHLSGEPVVAAPPSAVYRVRKFARKHRGQVLAVSLVAVALVIGGIGTATFAIRETRQKKQADEQTRIARDERDMATKARGEAQTLCAQAAGGLMRMASELGADTPVPTLVLAQNGDWIRGTMSVGEYSALLKEGGMNVESGSSEPPLVGGRLIPLIDDQEAMNKLIALGLKAIESARRERDAAEAAKAEVEEQRDAAESARKGQERLANRARMALLEISKELGPGVSNADVLDVIRVRKNAITDLLNGSVMIEDPERGLIQVDNVNPATKSEIIDALANTGMWLARTAKEQRDTAKHQAEAAKAVTDFLCEDLLGSVPPARAIEVIQVRLGKGQMSIEFTTHDPKPMTRDMSAAVDRAELKLAAACQPGGRLDGKPLIEASIRQALGGILVGADGGRAVAHLSRVIELRAQMQGPEHVDTLNAVLLLANTYLGQKKLGDARRELEWAWRSGCRLKIENAPREVFQIATMLLATEMMNKEDPEEAKAILAETIDLFRNPPKEHESAIAFAKVWFAMILMSDNSTDNARAKEGVVLFRKLLEESGIDEDESRIFLHEAEVLIARHAAATSPASQPVGSKLPSR